jgi:lysozyme family protein
VIENREVWLAAVFEAEGGWSNHPEDSGHETMMGITLATYREWHGNDEATAEELRCISKLECGEIYLSRYWNPVRGDQLPSGLDIYTADFAVNSGPGRAAVELQKLLGVKADTFVAEKTISAIRSKPVMPLLLDYHQARMDFLTGLKNWPTFGRGWTNRCNKVLALARTKVDRKPTLTELASSKIVAVAAVGVATSATAVVATPASQWEDIWGTIDGLLAHIPGLPQGLPDALHSAEPGVRATIEQAQQTAALPGLAGHIGAAVTLLTSLYTIWCRYRQYAKGRL